MASVSGNEVIRLRMPTRAVAYGRGERFLDIPSRFQALPKSAIADANGATPFCHSLRVSIPSQDDIAPCVIGLFHWIAPSTICGAVQGNTFSTVTAPISFVVINAVNRLTRLFCAHIFNKTRQAVFNRRAVQPSIAYSNSSPPVIIKKGMGSIGAAVAHMIVTFRFRGVAQPVHNSGWKIFTPTPTTFCSIAL